ncbi:MAG TPA: phosphatase PAP2 family protein [Polyangiaceae bacterium]
MPACLPTNPPACSAPLPTPLDAVGSDLLEAFGGTNLLFYAGAVGASAGLAFSGADESIRDATREHLASSTYGTAASLAGYILPLTVAPGTWLVGVVLHERDAAGAGSAALQALAVASATTFVLKVGVGREYPPNEAHAFAPFQIWSWPFAAWPSGHMASAFSVVGALTAYYGSGELWIPFVGYPVAAAVGVGLLSGDEHWASDLLAGAVIGQCIGWSIGRAFRARERVDATPSLSLAPMVAPSLRGLALTGQW